MQLQNPKTEPSIILEVTCECDDCGMRSVYEFFKDGSHKEVLKACGHYKRFPKRDKILKEMENETRTNS